MHCWENTGRGGRGDVTGSRRHHHRHHRELVGSSYLFRFASIRRASSLKPLDYFIADPAGVRNTRPWLELVVNGFVKANRYPFVLASLLLERARASREYFEALLVHKIRGSLGRKWGLMAVYNGDVSLAFRDLYVSVIPRVLSICVMRWEEFGERSFPFFLSFFLWKFCDLLLRRI